MIACAVLIIDLLPLQGGREAKKKVWQNVYVVIKGNRMYFFKDEKEKKKVRCCCVNIVLLLIRDRELTLLELTIE